MPVDNPLSLGRQHRLAPHREALESRSGGVVVDGERAEDDGRRFSALLEVGLLADEVLRLYLGPGQSGFHQVELLLELVAVGAVALLQPTGGAVDADANRRDSVRLAGLPDRVPEPCPLLEGHVDFPAELADVGNARRQRPYRAEVDEAADPKRKALVRD